MNRFADNEPTHKRDVMFEQKTDFYNAEKVKFWK